MCGGLPAPPWGRRAGGGQPPSQFAKVVARRRQGGFLQLPCSLGFRLASSATGGARLCPPAAFEKSGGKPAGKCFGFCNGMRWPAAHGERRARFVCRKARRERVGGWIAWLAGNRDGSGGRRARTARTKQGRGPLAPAPALVLRAFRARKTPPPPGVTQRRPPTPAPAHPRRP